MHVSYMYFVVQHMGENLEDSPKIMSLMPEDWILTEDDKRLIHWRKSKFIEHSVGAQYSYSWCIV